MDFSVCSEVKTFCAASLYLFSNCSIVGSRALATSLEKILPSFSFRATGVRCPGVSRVGKVPYPCLFTSSFNAVVIEQGARTYVAKDLA